VLGGALVRSGRTPSVHGFAEQLGVGWAMFALGAATALGGTWLVVQRRDEGGRHAGRDARRVMVLVMTIAGAIVIVGTVAPVLHDLIGGRSTAVGGQFFARTVGPLALVALPFLVLQLRRRRGLQRSGYGWSTAGHAGVLVLLAGIAVSTFDDIATFGLGNGDERRAAGVDVRNDGVTVSDGPRQGTEAVTAAMSVDGHALRPRIVVYPDRGGRLAEVAVHTGPVTDVHVTLETANDNESIVVTVHRRHGMWLVWLGAALVTVATLASALGPRRG
jgi:cytochrome c biogenesis factor